MGKPRITWEQYLGNLKVGTGLPENYAEHLARRVRQAGALGPDYRELKSQGLTFRIGMGDYNTNPERNAVLLKQWGFLGLTTLPHNGRAAGASPGAAPLVVGMINQRCLWIHPDYRGHGIGPEMMYDRALERIKRLPMDMGLPCLVDWEKRTHRQKNPPAINFTRQGVEALKRCYILLVERGAIDNRECAMPELGEYDG